MSNLEDILAYAWNKDAANLKPALDAEMQMRVSAAIDDLVAETSAKLFNPPNNDQDLSDESVEESN